MIWFPPKLGRDPLLYVGLLVAIIFLPGAISAATAPRWWVLAVAAPIICLYRPFKVTTAHCLFLYAVIYAAVSIFWSEVPWYGIQGLTFLLILFGWFCVGSGSASLAGALTGLALGLTLETPIVVMQLLGHDVAGSVVGPAPGTFANINVLSEICVLAVIAMAHLRVWWLVPGPAFGVIVVEERTALLALAVAGALYVWSRSRMLALAIILVVTSAVGAATFQHHGARMNSVTERSAIWKDTLAGFTPFGAGIGSYMAIFPKRATHVDTLLRRPEYAHNEFLHYTFELGLGVLPLLGVVFLALGGSLELERLLLAAILVEAAFAFPLHMPATGFVAALCLGRLVASRVGLRRARRSSRVEYAAYPSYQLSQLN